MTKQSLVFFIGILLVVTSAWAQQAEISGIVKDPSGATIPRATITAKSVATNVQHSAVTNRNGAYLLNALPPGVYRLTVDASGFEKRVIENVTVEVTAKLTENVTLAVGRTDQSVTVNGNQIFVNSTDASVSTVVNRDFVENIPLNGRSFQSLLTAVPGVTVVPSSAVGASGAGAAGEVTVNGQRTEENYFMVDGISVNTGAPSSGATGFGAGFSGSAPAETVLGTTQSMVSIDALQEFRAITSTYSAEYGRTPGGQFSFETRSGTNTFHGLLFDYLRNGNLDANNWFNNQAGLPRTLEHQNDFGGTFGGPVVIPGLYNGKDKTFFFFSYEGLRLQNPIAASLGEVPSTLLRQTAPAALQPFLNAFPVSSRSDNGNGTAYYSATYSSPGSLDTTAIRIDHSFNDRFKIFGRYSDSPSGTTSRDADDLAEVDTSTGHVRYVTLGSTNILSPHWDNDARFNFTSNNQQHLATLDSFGGAIPFSLSSVPGLSSKSEFCFYLLYDLYPDYCIGPQSTRQHQINVTDSMSFSVGRHNLKWGFDYRRVATTEMVSNIEEEGWYFDVSSLLANQLGGSNFFQFPLPVKPFYTNLGFCAQDEWKVNGRLSLSLGLRWDIDPAPGDSGGNRPYTLTTTNLAIAQAAPKGTPQWATTYGNVAPRLGLAYQIRQTAGYETVVRAGTGIFFDTTNIVASNGYYGLGFGGGQQLSGVPFPFTLAQVNSLPTPSAAVPYNTTIFGSDPHLKLPYTSQWNVAIEQALGGNQTLTVNYVGSAGRRLLYQEQYQPYSLGNQSFSPDGAVRLALNGSVSNYDSLQARYQRKLSHGLQALVSYTWSHSLDDASSNSVLNERLYSDSDFDVRHSFQAAVTENLPGRFRNKLVNEVLGRWSLDLRFSAQTGLPVDILGASGINSATGASIDYQANRVAGVPLYLYNPSFPGGRAINFNAFSIATDAEGNPVEGNSGRNPARGLGSAQVDLAARKEFALTEKLKLQFRAEAFNLFNHANFGAIYNDLSAGPALFGQVSNTQNAQLGALNPLYQTGGPRSLQLALRLYF